MDIRNLGENINKMHINDVMKGFLFHCQFEKSLNPKTLRAYTTDINQFAIYIKGTNDESDFKSMPKETLKGYLQEISHFKSKTIKRKVASLKAMLYNF